MPSSLLVTRELLFTHFAGQTTVLQKQAIARWVEEAPEREEFFYRCLHEWETLHPQFKPDTEAAINQFHEKVARLPLRSELADKQRLRPKARNAKDLQRWLLAASFLVAVLLGSWLFREPILQKSYSTSNGETRTLVLTDGSRVVLNANSRLQVPRFGFGAASRQVHLTGEGRFSVVHTPNDERFVVLTDLGFRVEVLGTEFNLVARRGTAQVVLQKGKVKVLYRGKPALAATTLMMTPGDVVSVNNTRKKLQVLQVRHPENYSAWQEGRFIFDQTSLADIKQLLKDNYGLEVSIQGMDESQVTVSGSFKAKTADELLQALSEVLNISVLRQDDKVLLINRNNLRPEKAR